MRSAKKPPLPYSNDRETAMSDIYADARARLVPWLTADVLEKHLREATAFTPSVLDAVLQRLTTLERPDLAGELFARMAEDDAAMRNLAPALSRAPEPIRRFALRPLLDALTPVLAAPTQIEEASGVLAIDPNDADRLALDSEDDLKKLDGSEVGARALRELVGHAMTVEGYWDAWNDFVVTKAVSVTDPELLLETKTRPTTHALGQKTTSLAAVKALVTAVSEPLEALGDITHIEVIPEELAEQWVDLIESVVLDAPDGPTQSFDMLLTAEGYDAYPDLKLRLQSIACLANDVLVQESAGKIAHAITETVLDATQIPPELGIRLTTASKSLSAGGYIAAVIEKLEALTLERQLFGCTTLLLPVDPIAAGQNACAIYQVAIKSPDEEADVASQSLALVNDLAEEHPELAESIRSLSYSTALPELAGKLLELHVRLWPSDIMQDDFFELAVSQSPDAARAGMRNVLERASTPTRVLDDVLRAVAEQLDPTNDADAFKALVAAKAPVLPKAEQLGLIAAYGGARTADRWAKAIDFPGSLERALFRQAERSLKRDLARAAEIYSDVETWRNVGHAARAVAVDAYASAFAKAADADSLKVVLASTLRFFPDADTIPNIKKLRDAGLKAVQRLDSEQPDEELQSTIAQAIEQLRWNVSTKATTVARIRRWLSSSD
jgi:hypothetical protein